MEKPEHRKITEMKRKLHEEQETARRLRRKLEAMQAKYGEPDNQTEDRQ